MAGSQKHRETCRYPLMLAILYQQTGAGSGPPCMGWTRDLSEGGACLDLPERLEPGRIFRISFGAEQGGLAVPAEVIWVDTPGGAGGHTLHGVTFPALTWDEQHGLRDLLRRRGQARQAGVRHLVDVSVTSRPRGSAEPPVGGRIENLSLTGLRLRLPQVVLPGTVLELRFASAKGEIAAEGIVVWVEPPEQRRQEDFIRHGVQFTELPPASEMALALLVAEML